MKDKMRHFSRTDSFQCCSKEDITKRDISFCVLHIVRNVIKKCNYNIVAINLNIHELFLQSQTLYSIFKFCFQNEAGDLC